MSRHRWMLALGPLLAFLPQPVWSSGLKVAPIRVTLDGDNAVQVMRIENSADASVRVQLRLFEWSQKDGQDNLTPTRDVLANPAMFEIPAKGQQTVRIGRLVAPGGAEKSYRLLVEEIPGPARDRSRQITMLLRISIPVFVPAPDAASRLSWSAWAPEPGRVTLAIENGGNAHVQIRRIDIGKGTGSYRQMIYLLPGSRREISIAMNGPVSAGQRLDLVAATDGPDIAAHPIVEAGPHVENGK